MRDIIEADVGSGCMCIFIQGGAGDINPLMMARDESREKDFDDVKRLGELLAVEVKRALAFAKEVPGESDSFEALSTELQFRNRWNASEELRRACSGISSPN